MKRTQVIENLTVDAKWNPPSLFIVIRQMMIQFHAAMQK